MKPRNLWFVAAIWLLGFAPAAGMGSAAGVSKESDAPLDQYDIHFFGEATRSSPERVIGFDNNAEILLACVSGKTPDELKEMGIRFADSQIELLELWRLLEREKGLLKTTFPILISGKTEPLRAMTKDHGYKLGHRIHKDLKALTKKLQPMKRARNHYTILFSYVIDGLVWDLFEERGLLEPTEITAEKPFWRGMLWAVYPPRTFSCGTNTISEGSVSLKINWSEVALEKMKPLLSWENIKSLLNDYLNRGKVRDKILIEAFKPLNVVDSSGRVLVPVIVEKRGDPLYEICLSISKSVANYVLEELDLGKLQQDLDLQNRGEALLIVYHELMWDLMDYLEAQGLTRKPEAFAFPARAQPRDIGDLVFIVRQDRVK